MSDFSSVFAVEGCLGNIHSNLLLLFTATRQYLLDNIDVFAPIGILQLVVLSWILIGIFMAAVLFTARSIVKSMRRSRRKLNRVQLQDEDYEFDLEMCEADVEHEAVPVLVRISRERSRSLGSAGKNGYQLGMLVPVIIPEQADRAHAD